MPWKLASFGLVLFELNILRILSVPLWLMGAWIILRCSIDMVGRGGTPAHMDPPKQLIITGLYHYVRNPIYLGALLAVLGYILWTGSGWVIAYFVCYGIAFHILIVFFEEPVLRQKFGREYEEYCQKVPRWIPRFTRD